MYEYDTRMYEYDAGRTKGPCFRLAVRSVQVSVHFFPHVILYLTLYCCYVVRIILVVRTYNHNSTYKYNSRL